MCEQPSLLIVLNCFYSSIGYFHFCLLNSAKQQAQKTNQKSPPAKIQSINVPLHKQNANIQSMTQRSTAPVIARRLSMPFSRLPPLIPKPNMLKRPNATQQDNLNVANKVPRLSVPNGSVSAVKSDTMTTKITVRPIPALEKVYNMINSQFVPVANATLLRNSMPPPLTNRTQLQTVTRIDPTKLTTISKVRPAHITRLPPTLKPAPRPQPKPQPQPLHQTQLKSIAMKTYAKLQPAIKIETKLPIINSVQVDLSKKAANGAALQQEHKKTETKIQPESSQTVPEERRIPNVM